MFKSTKLMCSSYSYLKVNNISLVNTPHLDHTARVL